MASSLSSGREVELFDEADILARAEFELIQIHLSGEPEPSIARAVAREGPGWLETMIARVSRVGPMQERLTMPCPWLRTSNGLASGVGNFCAPLPGPSFSPTPADPSWWSTTGWPGWSGSSLVRRVGETRTTGSSFPRSWPSPLPASFIVADEAWGPNVPVAAARLRELGIPVVQDEGAPENADQDGLRGRLPSRDGTFINRHESFLASEVFRALGPGDSIATQQVETHSYDAITAALGLEPPDQGESGLSFYRYRRQLEEAGFDAVAVRLREEHQVFSDVGLWCGTSGSCPGWRRGSTSRTAPASCEDCTWRFLRRR